MLRYPSSAVYGSLAVLFAGDGLSMCRICTTFAALKQHITCIQRIPSSLRPMSKTPTSSRKSAAEAQVVITRGGIGGISEVMLNDEVRRTNLQVARDILRQIEEVSQDGTVEIIFADDIRKYIALLQEEGLSPLVVDSRLQIRLPLYELTLSLPPLAKSLYLLYMRHPEGLYRKQIADFEDELLSLYAACIGRRADDAMRRTIARLTDFSTKNADKQMARINKVFRGALAERAVHYIPTSSSRGERRRLDFDRVSFHLPPTLSGSTLTISTWEQTPPSFTPQPIPAKISK